MNTTADTRRESHNAIKPLKEYRRALVLKILKGRRMTAEEVTAELLRIEAIPYFDRNFAAPRLTELSDMGKIEVVGKKLSKRTEKNIAIWSIVDREEKK